MVEGLVENDSRFINRRAGGWIACPLRGHSGEELDWQEDNYRKGSVLHGNPPASFRAAPTYVLEHPLDNFVAGRELIAEAIAGKWGNAEAARLGNENSEGALTWNVLRPLQEAGSLGIAACVLADAEPVAEPELCFWGRRITIDGSSAWTELQSIRGELEPGVAPPIEPDACLHVPGFGWVVVEASFGPTPRGSTIRRASRRSSSTTRLRAPVSSTRRRSGRRSCGTSRCCFCARSRSHTGSRSKASRPSSSPSCGRATRLPSSGRSAAAWQRRLMSVSVVSPGRPLRALPDEPELQPLRLYLENKSYGLRPAFALQEADADEPAPL